MSEPSPTPEKRRIRMLKRGAGPDGHFEPGKEYELDKAYVDKLIMAGAAEDLDEIAEPTPPARPNYDAWPFGDSGVIWPEWALWRDRGALSRRDGPVLTAELREDLDAKWIELRWRSHPGKLSGEFRRFPDEGLAELLVLIGLPDNSGDVVVWDGSEYIKVRVFRIAPAVGDGADEKPAIDEQVDDDPCSALDQRGPGRRNSKALIRRAIRTLDTEDERFKDLSRRKKMVIMKKWLLKVKTWEGSNWPSDTLMNQVLAEPWFAKNKIN